MTTPDFNLWSGALLVNKPAGISSFGVVDQLKQALKKHYNLKNRQLPKIGHGGTLDPFATGLLVVLLGNASKLSRYFLESTKTYQGWMRFGQTTIPGDPTEEVSETSSVLPQSLHELQDLAQRLTLQAYMQTPPMHSAKKHKGQALYKLARQGIEIEREAKLCHLYEFEMDQLESPRARFRVKCSAGTYIRTLAQDFSRLLGSVGMLDSLCRSHCGHLSLDKASQLEDLCDLSTPWHQRSCFVPFDRLLDGFPSVQATRDETDYLRRGQQTILINLVGRAEFNRQFSNEMNSSAKHLAIYHQNRLAAVALRDQHIWKLERVF